MAVGTGAGALNPTKPITVNDFMEAIAPPGVKPPSGIPVNCATAGDLTGSTEAIGDNVCFVGGAGYTEVVDDIIVEVTSALNANATLAVGLLTDGDTDDPNYFIDAGTIPLAVGTYSVLRGNLSWADTANTVAERTFAAGGGTGGNITYAVSIAATGRLRMYARTHYTAVNFGPGL